MSRDVFLCIKSFDRNYNQANILGPFLWDKSYETCLTRSQETPLFLAEAYHTGYKNKLAFMVGELNGLNLII